VSPPVHAARIYTHHRHLLLVLSPKADTHFTVPQRVEGSSRLSRSSWLVTYQDGLSVYRRSPILILTGTDVAQLYVDRGQRVTTEPNRRRNASIRKKNKLKQAT